MIQIKACLIAHHDQDETRAVNAALRIDTAEHIAAALKALRIADNGLSELADLAPVRNASSCAAGGLGLCTYGIRAVAAELRLDSAVRACIVFGLLLLRRLGLLGSSLADDRSTGILKALGLLLAGGLSDRLCRLHVPDNRRLNNSLSVAIRRLRILHMELRHNPVYLGTFIVERLHHNGIILCSECRYTRRNGYAERQCRTNSDTLPHSTSP